jgi:cytochrome P450
VATALDTGRALAKVVLPTLAKGAIVRRPTAVALAERFGLDTAAVAEVRRLRDRYGPAPVPLKVPGRSFALVLSPEDVGRLLEHSPEPFSLATKEKTAALAHFQPRGVLISHGLARTARRELVEEVLETGQEVHSLAGVITDVVRDEVDLLLRHAVAVGGLTWNGFAQAWWRVVRRIVLGNGARADDTLTDELSTLRGNGNWAYLHPRRERLRQDFDRRLRGHLDRAEAGSLAGTGRDIADQVPHWLFAFDAAGIATVRALALLAGQPTVDRRAAVLEAVRLWPTTPMVLRESTAPTEWAGTTYPEGTTFLVYTPFFHRDPDRLPFADSFAPEIWTDGRADADPALIPFSGGPGVCPGRNLVLLTTSAMLDAMLEHHGFRLRSHELGARLPGTLDHFRLEFDVTQL